MQTIKVVTTSTPAGMTFTVHGGKQLANIGADFFNKRRYAGQFGVFASCNNSTFADAAKFIRDAICSHFAQFGLTVEFVNA